MHLKHVCSAKARVRHTGRFTNTFHSPPQRCTPVDTIVERFHQPRYEIVSVETDLNSRCMLFATRLHYRFFEVQRGPIIRANCSANFQRHDIFPSDQAAVIRIVRRDGEDVEIPQ